MSGRNQHNFDDEYEFFSEPPSVNKKGPKQRNISRRSNKIASGVARVVKDKFTEPQQPYVPTLTPKTPNQSKALQYMQEGKALCILEGSAGVGKSMLAAYHASKKLLAKECDKILLLRPYVATGKDMGSLPGDVNLKLGPYLAPILSHFEKFLGKAHLDYCLDKKIIEFAPLQFIRGSSWENCICIAEEVQNATIDEIKAVVTRLGEDAQLIFACDNKQHDLRGMTGVEYIVDLVKKARISRPECLDTEEVNELITNVGIVEFTQDDVVRSGLCRSFVKLFNAESTKK